MDVTDILSVYGAPAVFKRRVGMTTAFTEVGVNVYLRAYAPNELVGGVVQGDMKGVMSHKEITLSSLQDPRRGDFLDALGTTWSVQAASPRYYGGTLVGYDLWVRG